MIKVLITGNAGYIGSHLSKMLRTDYEIYGLDINPSQFPVTDHYQLDINRIFNIDMEFDCVIHLAALVNVSESERKPIQY
jgi:nucleoside-diphosphate-sugar epimerase